MDSLIEMAEAQRRLQSVGPAAVTEWVPLADSHGRILAETVTAQVDMPPYDRAMMDGYAVRAADIVSATSRTPVPLELCAASGLAGHAPGGAVKKGGAARIMTGAPLPEGSDAVLRREWVAVAEWTGPEAAACIHALRAVTKEEAVQRRGTGMRAGDPLLTRCAVLTPTAIGALAMQGHERVPVVRRPRVAVITVGAELTAPGQGRAPYEVWDANASLLVALIRSWGAEVHSIRQTDDSIPAIADAAAQAVSACDVVVTSGGVSVGDADVTPLALERVGVKRLFWGVWMRPGTPVYAGESGGIPVLAVSGNPRAALANAAVFLLPMILRGLGAESRMRRHVGACRVYGMPNKPLAKHVRLVSGTLCRQEGTLALRVESDQSPGLIRADTDAFAIVPAGHAPTQGGVSAALFLQPQPPTSGTDNLEETAVQLLGLRP